MHIYVNSVKRSNNSLKTRASIRTILQKATPFVPSQGQIIPVEKFKKIIRSRIVALICDYKGCPIL